ncbi:DUF6755 family protein [Paludibaculum fermentans]|uniref:Uncharacterized protein n=1 Tax=Paludibaculum fermentans TaxID=1473598 RepID=A0A7S7NWF9_PALFE|nr:DUF6755 family protein [Paludibaculum fermentans]QOY91055.1 hypothetical protein IRI77_14245 [Paludibaculum fermentans]
MTDGESPLRRRSLKGINGALALIVVILVVQIWMLMASVETYLAGHHEAAVPGAVLSGLLFAGSALLLRYVNRLDRQTRDQS